MLLPPPILFVVPIPPMFPGPLILPAPEPLDIPPPAAPLPELVAPVPMRESELPMPDMSDVPEDIAPLPVLLPVPVDGDGDVERLVAGDTELLPDVPCPPSLWQPASRANGNNMTGTDKRFFIPETPIRHVDTARYKPRYFFPTESSFNRKTRKISSFGGK